MQTTAINGLSLFSFKKKKLSVISFSNHCFFFCESSDVIGGLVRKAPTITTKVSHLDWRAHSERRRHMCTAVQCGKVKDFLKHGLAIYKHLRHFWLLHIKLLWINEDSLFPTGCRRHTPTISPVSLCFSPILKLNTNQSFGWLCFRFKTKKQKKQKKNN